MRNGKMNNKRKLEIKTQLSEGDVRYKLIKPSSLKSNVWHNFDLVQFEGKLEDFACCKKCKDVLAYSAKTGTGSLIRHNCDNQSIRRRIKIETKRQHVSSKKAFDPLDYAQNNDDPDSFYTIQSLSEVASETKKRNYGEAFDDNSGLGTGVQQDEVDDVYGEYVDMGYLIKPEPQEEERADEIDNDNNINSNNVMDLLMQSTDGQNVLNYYDLHNHLDFKHREVLFNTLTGTVYNNAECTRYNNTLRKVSLELRQLFPQENYSTLELHKQFTRAELNESLLEDVQLFNLLRSWKLAHLYDHFRAESVTIDVLKLLEERHKKKLFAQLTVGDEVLFDHHFQSWTAMGMPEPAEILPPMPTINNITLTAILKESSNGLKIKKFFEQHGRFTEPQRVLLINTIARYIELNGLSLTLAQSQKLEQEIVNMFPSEKLEFYTNGKRGRIYTKVYNNRRSLKPLDSTPESMPKSNDTQLESSSTVAELNGYGLETVSLLSTKLLVDDEHDEFWDHCYKYRFLVFEHGIEAEVHRLMQSTFGCRRLCTHVPFSTALGLVVEDITYMYIKMHF